MKYGLMVFNKTRNIGDDIQSYVAMKYLPTIDYYVDRENLDSFISNSNEKVAVIMNGWYIHHTMNWPPSPYIKPLPISMHFTTRDFWDIKDEQIHLCGYGEEYLKSISPIGSRDTHTLKLLSEKNIKTEFTGCLTLTLEKFNDVQKKNYICAVDVSSKVVEKLKKITNLEIKEITHIVLENYYTLSWEERVKNVEELLKIYQGAQYVITSRLHCALPCIALGTSVLIIHDKYNDDRFKDYLKFIDFCYEEDFLKDNYVLDFLNHVNNKNEYIKLRDNLNLRCRNFIQECEKNNNNELLPDINLYLNYVIPKFNWFKQLALNLEEKLKVHEKNNIIDKEIITEKDDVINSLKTNIDILQNESLDKIQELSKISEDLSYKLEHIQNSKCWRICKKLYKIRDKIVGNK